MRIHVVTNVVVRRSDVDFGHIFRRIPALTSAHCLEVSTDERGHLQGVFAPLKNLRHLRVNFSSGATKLDLAFLSENCALGVRRLEFYFAGAVNEFPHQEFIRFLFDFSRLPAVSKAKKVFVEFGDNKTAFPTSFVNDVLEKLEKLEGKLTVELPLHEPDVVASLFHATDDVKYKKNDQTFASRCSNAAIFMFGQYATITNDTQTANAFFSLVKQKDSMF